MHQNVENNVQLCTDIAFRSPFHAVCAKICVMTLALLFVHVNEVL
jgi:hypothetical protein